MSRFVKKPVEIDATQWFKNGDHPEDESDYGKLKTEREGKVVSYFRHPTVSGEKVCEKCAHTMHNHGWIDTLEGGHNVCVGDWIVTGIQGEHYPCKPDIFEQTYDLVEETSNA